jgi:cation diffusion facilitator CzcD-associated flavoprotein CzcO
LCIGATAAQIIPEILPVSKNLTVYQRSPNWVVPREDGPVSSLRRAVYRYLPPVRWRMRGTKMDIREEFYDSELIRRPVVAMLTCHASCNGRVL